MVTNSNTRIYVIIPAHNEEAAIAQVIKELPTDLIEQVVVVNNASTDQTAVVAQKAGALVLEEPIPGYGRACLRGIAHVNKRARAHDIVVFLDGDYSDYPAQLPNVIRPLLEEDKDLVIGSRNLGKRATGSMTPQQVFGNWLATLLIRLFYGVRYTDLGPFRAIRIGKLTELAMCDTTYGWTVEMQVKAAKRRYQVAEVPVDYRRRIGTSKISGTVKGTILAGYKIITTIFKCL